MQDHDYTAITNFLEDKLNSIHEEISDLESQREHISRLLESIQSKHPRLDKVDLPSFIRDNTTTQQAWDTDLTNIHMDFSLAKNLLERIFIVFVAADKAGKYITAHAVGDYLLAHGATNASVKNIRGTVGRTISEYREHFQEVDTRIYKYLPEAEGCQIDDDNTLAP